MNFFPFKTKIILLKKQNIISVAFCALLFGCAFSGIKNNLNTALSSETFALPTSNKIIVIDAGHGGIDAGASAGKLKEKDLNLDIAKKLQALIEQSGGYVVLTRSEDVSTEDKNRSKNITQKKSDLTQRKKLAETNKADMFISIHMNKFSSDKYKGAQVFYNKNSKESQILAECVQNSLKNNLDKTNNRLAKGENSIFVLKENKSTAILVECGFLSNPDEANLLADENYRMKIAQAIFFGICDYAKN